MNLCVEVGYCTEYVEVIYDATEDELHSYYKYSNKYVQMMINY